VKSLFGSIGRAVSNRSAVPLTTRSAGGPVSLFSASGNSDIRLMQTYGDVGTVHAIVNRISSAVSSAEWHLYRKAASGLKEDRKEVTSHAALDRLLAPNNSMTRQELFETSQQHIELTGETDILVSLGGGLPTELRPLRPDRVIPVPNPYTFISGYIYQTPDGDRIPLEVNEIMQIRSPNPLDPYTGLGPIQAVLTDIDSSKYSTEWNKNFFLNSAEPGGIIQVSKRLDDDQYREMAARWAEQHRGVNKAHRVAIIEDGAQWVDRTATQKDMEFTQLSTLSRDKILEAFGFPKSMLGIVEDVNRANAEASEYLFDKWLIVPRLERWKQLLNHNFLAYYANGARLEFDYDSPVRENSQDEIQMLVAKWGAVAANVPLGFDAAEMLEALDLPAVAFKAPAPPPAPIIAPPGHAPSAPAIEPAEPDAPVVPEPDAPMNVLTAAGLRAIEAANRWVAVEDIDDNTCEPCRENDGMLYKNREDAYKDYPDGKHFVNCVGEEFGNHCRGRVEKRGKS
jgi:HK97 family phage portal protein